MKSNVALSYIAMLSVVGFFLWVIRNFVRGLRQKDQLPPVSPLSSELEDDEKKTANWPVHIYLNNADDIPIPGEIVSVSPTGAFMESSACLVTGQEITLYVEVDRENPVRLSASVTWARTGRDGRNASQLIFPANETGRTDLYSLAGH